MTAREILAQLRSIPAPPGYAKALYRQYRETRDFLSEVDLENKDQARRLVARAEDIKWLVDDMREANRLASDRKQVPMVMVPSGIWAEILGKAHAKPQDGEHWPEDRPEGPITWKD